MQIHLNGFHHGDPDLKPDAQIAHDTDVVDVLVVGSGPAGSILAAQLADFPEISTRFIERRETPMTLGQADGVACRTVEMFNAFDLAHKLLREAYQITETVFWGPDEKGDIHRTGRVPDTEAGLSEFPHVIVNQARLQQYLVDRAAASPSRLQCEYGMEVVGIEVPADHDQPLEVKVRRAGMAESEPDLVIKARYVVGCDGARSSIRRGLGLELKGDSMNHAYGVLDVLAVTDFPDIRHKAIIRTDGAGGIGIIPREGGFLSRLYVDLGPIEPGDQTFRTTATKEMIVEAAQKYFTPYTFEPKEIPWWSIYEVAQRLTDRMDDVPEDERGSRSPRVFIAGDASHTHSAKAGQGMNVSMQDTFNLGWKLVSVLLGRSPQSLLDTYNEERRPVAKELIEFDRYFAAAMGGKRPETMDEKEGRPDLAGVKEIFQQAGRYTAGVATHYPIGSTLIGDDAHQKLANGYPIGYRFHSAPVVRLADAKPYHLGHVHKADARWRLFAFADQAPATSAESKLGALGEWLMTDPESPVVKYTPQGADIDAVFDAHAVYQQGFQDFDVEDVPRIFLPTKGALGLKDYEKVFTPDLENEDIFDLREIDRSGALVIVRPDQYVAHVLPLDAYDEIAAYFARFMTPVS
ncbi:FAD-dependent monooxygenase [Nocardioides sp. cx-173]|uniref:FAD-dependent monooxygenase n=1 Tax=Nocardioides sp. cx-173 TaxID=2898796 RepID=UPI001E31FB60|nr:FAD-dependent monooxygenase [Nocardioides sp. cx-173]MCD4526652.1 FAD-dependent monooxygenase [Nocardioides sp. cx-173]UGB40745.1 FAD-dependent monooxygenase [Nocardioides sp. cx-173]